MANTLAVCLLGIIFFCADVSLARQLPKECTKGPDYWCTSIRTATDCGAVAHCTATVWESQNEDVRKNAISEKFVKLLNELKDVKDLINEDYLSTRLTSACRDLPVPFAAKTCKDNSAHLSEYLMVVLKSKTSAETMCQLMGMCNNQKLENILAANDKKSNDPVKPRKGVLLGGERCTWGPSYWCSNISTGHECKATHHCIQRVWSKMQVEDDNDDICKICKDMVTQARDQLQSNETQEELKEVFDGSCKLIPVKLVAKECMKLADEFIPDLVETLASQMNPQAVCSVAGLCNNAEIDKMLEKYHEELEKRNLCTNCNTAVGVLRKRFDETSYEDFLLGLLQVCRKTGTLTDACSMLVFKYYENILAGLKKDFTPTSVCHLSAMCEYKYHSHDDFTFPVEKKTELKASDDVPCEFCEQLVTHLRDVLIANTTEVEFYKVLTGLCHQFGGFKTECLSLVDQYYPVIYNYLVSDMKPAEICTLVGICGKNIEEPIAPLMPKELVVKAITPSPVLIGTDEKNSEKIGKVPIASKQTNVKVVEPELSMAPLPIERMFPRLPQSKTLCTFCEYFLHYLQVELSDNNNEDQIKSVVEKACDRLPDSVDAECKQFVTEYGPAVIALLVQEIDPSSVCPALGLCPQTQEVRHVSINSDKSNCPLCLFAVEQLEAMLKNNRTETSIRHALDNLCTHLSTKLRTECTDFVDQYSQQLIEMLIADISAPEICVYLKLCNNTLADPLEITSPIDKYHEKPQLMADRNNFRKPMLPQHMLNTGDIETNEIPDHTRNGRPIHDKVHLKQKTVCVVCEFVMREIDDQIKDKHNDDEIKKVVHGVCKRMPKSVRADCDQFVEKYADLIISLLSQELDPNQVCEELKLCKPQDERLGKVKQEILDCAVCETVVMAVKKVLNNDKVDRNIVHVVEKSCNMLPVKYYDRCHTMMEIYGASIIHLIEDVGSKGVCQKIGLCAAQTDTMLHMYRENKH